MIRSLLTIYFFFCLVMLPNTFASPTRSLCRRDQRDALLEVQKEFHVPTNSWNKCVDCCSCNGVTCDTILGEVISLKLFDSNITANTSLKSSSALFKLRHLRELDLQDCCLQGEIPSSIRNLSHLITSLDLSRNHLVGEVPASVGNLNQLRTMSLSENMLRGNVPTSFANLTKLSELDLSGNQFTGGDIVLANLTSLSDIKVSFNRFNSSIFDYLSGLHNLNTFLGYGNSFSGPFPSSLLMISSLVEIGLGGNQFVGSIDFMHTSSSSRLEVLDVSDNDFDGLIPESISKLRCLYTLDLSHNNFGRRIPRSISKLRSLINLHLSYNNLGGRVPRSVSKLVSLSFIDLSYNKLEGQVPNCLWRFSKLHIVQLSSNSFSSFGKSVDVVDGTPLKELHFGSNLLKGPFPQWICKLRDLWALDLSNNHITGSIPQCLKNSNLVVLNLRNNSFGGFLPDLFINGSQLRSLDVSRNNLVGKLPKSLINCEWLEFLNVKENKIKDMFPFWLGSLKALMVLVLGSNAFYGPVYDPSAYLGFPSMKIIDISNNNFVGLLPQDYFVNWTDMSVVWSDYDLPGLEYIGYEVRGYGSIDFVYKGVEIDFNRIFLGFKAIDFSGNKFSGQITRSIGLMSELRVLNFSGNTFTSNIPPSLANITKLEALDLSRNKLSGEIPQSLGKLSLLSYINVSHNQLEGLVPQSTQFGSQNCSSFVGNPGLYGLEEICKESHHIPVPTSQQPEESLSESKEPMLNWIAAAIAFGPGVFCGLVIGHIFTSYKHEWFITR